MVNLHVIIMEPEIKLILAVFILQTNYPSGRTEICSLSLSSSSIKTGNRRIMRHNFLRLVIRRF